MSFWQELRKRRVIRVAVSYTVIAWLVVQVADTVLPAFDAPDWSLRALILALALGLPVAMIASWALQRSPEGIRWDVRSRQGGLRIGALAATIAALALAWFFYGKPAIRQEVIAETRSIAIMPFENMSQVRENDYFSDGLAETTLDMLTRVKDLKVIARDSSFALRDSKQGVSEIGRQLGAAHLLEGSIQQAGNLLRITAHLVRTRDGTRIWSRRFDRPRADVFAIQDEIALEVVKALSGLLPAVERDRMLDQGTDNVAAYDAYLKGLALLPDMNVAGLREAQRHFDHALELDPAYARAHVGAARALFSIGLTEGLPDEDWVAHARHVERALELAPDLGEAHVQQGIVLVDKDDMPAAEREYRRGLELAPGYAVGHEALANLLFATNRPEEGLRTIARAVDLDPMDIGLRLSYSGALGQVGRLGEAESEIDRVLQQNPDFAPGYMQKAMLRMLQGDLATALRQQRQSFAHDPQNYTLYAGECGMYLEYSAYAELDACLAALQERFPAHEVDPFYQQQAWVANGRLVAEPGLIARTSFDEPIDQAALLAQVDRNAEALEVLQRQGHPLLAASPDTSSEPLWAVLAVGGIRKATGDAEGGRALLEDGLRRALALAPGPTPHLRQWNEAIALGLLGRNQEACAAIRAAGEAGVVTALRKLDLAANLQDLRADPCYAVAMQPVRNRAAEAVRSAREAGLLPGTRPAPE